MLLPSVVKSLFLRGIYAGSTVFFLNSLTEHWVLCLLWGGYLWSWGKSGCCIMPWLQSRKRPLVASWVSFPTRECYAASGRPLRQPTCYRTALPLCKLSRAHVQSSKDFSIEIHCQPAKILFRVMYWISDCSPNSYVEILTLKWWCWEVIRTWGWGHHGWN